MEKKQPTGKNRAVRRADSEGRIVLPKFCRNMLGIQPGDALRIQFIGPDTLTLSSAESRCCIHCGAMGPLCETTEGAICFACLETLVDQKIAALKTGEKSAGSPP